MDKTTPPSRDENGSDLLKEIPTRYVKIQDAFWGTRLDMNASKAIYHQWEQLKNTGCIENFRLVAEGVQGFREGFFFADSDAYKWLEAAARVYAAYPTPKLKGLMDGFIDLVQRTQTEDGYIFTYNQFFTPDVRWKNLQIEHELYCHGHLIEAAISHFEATGERQLIKIAIKAADLLVDEFTNAGPKSTPGHQEIEIALLRLYRTTGNQSYLDLAEHFLEQRGRIKPFFPHILANNSSFEARRRKVNQAHAEYLASNLEHKYKFQLPSDNTAPKPPWGKQRWFLNTATGKYFQQHQPIREQTIPVGHAVRFAYLQTAIAKLCQERPDDRLRETLEAAWDHMVSRRMYITGGIGSLPNIEGFGRDYELDPAYSYSETCASLGVIFWNWEMTKLTQEAKYADLSEWQFYNGAAVGLGLDGTSYLYNNPLSCDGGITRKSWYKCPCCPSNISRTWADLGRYLFSMKGEDLWVHQYVGSKASLNRGLEINMQSGFPWDTKVRIEMEKVAPSERTIYLRIPSWANGVRLGINGERRPVQTPPRRSTRQTASGYDPAQSWYLPIKRSWSAEEFIELTFHAKIKVRPTHPRVRSTRSKVAISQGPLVYCLESHDNPNIDIFQAVLNPASLRTVIKEDLFGGISQIHGQTMTGKSLTLIPYYLWANRGESQMTVYIKSSN